MKGHLKVVIWCTFLLLQLRAFAGFYIVTDTNDNTKITSLRGAIVAANRNGGQNIIVLGLTFDFPHHSKPIVYHLTIPGADESAGLTGDLNINRGETTIIGINPQVIIDATGLGDRVFNVSSNAHLTLENLVITGGNAAGFNNVDADGESGGAIYNVGILDMINCLVIGNQSGNGNYAFPVQGKGGSGGGIFNNGIFAMEHCVITGNNCGIGSNDQNFGAGGDGGNGGGIYNCGKMTLDTCIVSNNFSAPGQNGIAVSGPIGEGGPGGKGGDGGGIYNSGELNLTFSTISFNGTGSGGEGYTYAPENGGSGGNGGGVFNSGTLNLNTCTLSQNECGGGGNGGQVSFNPVNGGNGGDGGNGAGIYNVGKLTSTSCTIAMNMAGMGGNGSNGNATTNPASGGAGGSGGGIANDTNGNIVIRNTLIALNIANTGGAGGTNTLDILNLGQGLQFSQIIGNPGANGIGFDVAGAFTSDGFNLIGTGDGSAGFVNGVHADKVGTDASPIDPLLGPLQMNGGFTPTHALLWGSPAIDQGNCFGVHSDQRGHYRPYIYSSIARPHGGDGSDIGSFELDTRQPH